MSGNQGMSFKVEQKGQMFLVVNNATGEVRGRFKTEGEAEVYRERVQRIHDDGVSQASARLTPPKPIESDE